MRDHLRSALVMAAAFSLAMLVFATPAVASTRTLTGYNYWKSLAGVTVVKHWSYHTFSYDGTSLLSSPRSLDNSYWSLPPTWHKSDSRHWDWYTAGRSGTGRGDVSSVFVTGVPTPWGPIGSSLKDGQWGYVRYNGTGYIAYY